MLDAIETSRLTLNKNGDLTERKVLHGIGGSFLKTYQEGTRNYFEGKKGQLSDIGFLEIKFDIIQRNGKSFWNCKMIPHFFERL